MKKLLTPALILAGSLAASAYSHADLLHWQTNEVQYQYGDLDIPSYAGGGDEHVSILTLQHASGWKYGDTFAFIDFSNGSENGHDAYGEIYANFSLGKITGRDLSYGIVKDIGVIAGYNWGDDGRVRKYLPGMRVALNLPGFAFLNVEMTAYIDDNRGTGHGGAPQEDDSYMVDINWALPWEWNGHAFSLEGHVEYIGSRDNEFNQKVEGHVLAQPQLRYDLGKTLWEMPNKLFVGVEFQYWQNKYGDDETDERATQVLAVYRF